MDWRTLRDRVARGAGGLRSLGIEPGDRVSILSLNGAEFLEAQYAAAWAGAIIVPLNFRFALAELRHAIHSTQSRLLIADTAFASVVDLVCREIPDIRILWLGDGAPERAPSYESLLIHDPIEDRSVDRDDSLAGIFFTGGTTGTPRGVALSNGNLRVHFLEMRYACEFDRASVHPHILPMFHLAGFGVCHALTSAGGAHCFLPQFSPEGCLDLISRHRPSHLSLVPTMLAMVMDEFESRDPGPGPGPGDGVAPALAALKMLTYGAAPIPLALLERVIRLLPQLKLRQFYGMTELSGACVTLGPEHHGLTAEIRSRMASVGQSMSTSEIMIAREDGSPCSTNEPGEILARGPQVMVGYWGDAAGTAQALRNGWMHTGDVGCMDEQGFITIFDRSKDMIISGGENVFSIEVENALANHPRVSQCAIIGVPDLRWGERVHGIVVLRPEETTPTQQLAHELEEHCGSLIARYKVPKSWTFRTEPLPLSGVGKVQKQKLRTDFINAG